MMFIFNKDTVLKMCEYFGGQTIKIPTTKQLMKALRILALYESVDIDKIPLEVAIDKHNSDPDEITGYNTLKNIMENYKV